MPESAWSTARSALLLACFDDTLCEHDFQTIVGWPRSAFHALAAECEAMDVESLRAWLFRARAVEDGVRHRKLLTFALDHMGMEPSRKDVWLRTRLLAQANECLGPTWRSSKRGVNVSSGPTSRRFRPPRHVR